MNNIFKFKKTLLAISFILPSIANAGVVDFINTAPTNEIVEAIEVSLTKKDNSNAMKAILKVREVNDEVAIGRNTSDVYIELTALNKTGTEKVKINSTSEIIGDSITYSEWLPSTDSTQVGTTFTQSRNATTTSTSSSLVSGEWVSTQTDAVSSETRDAVGSAAGPVLGFNLHANGVTVTCNGVSPGDTGVINGVTYTAVDNQMLSDKIGSTDPVFYETACTSLVTDMNVGDGNFTGVFYNSTLSPDISTWDTSHVTDMSVMFYKSPVFNSALNFDTSSVTNMRNMFSYASAFNKPINFDTSSLTNMISMFYGASALNKPVNFTDTSKVTSMRYMFGATTAFNQPLNFDTLNVTNMDYMFKDASAFNQDISDWCVPLISVKPTSFDYQTGFVNNAALQPQWGTCP